MYCVFPDILEYICQIWYLYLLCCLTGDIILWQFSFSNDDLTTSGVTAALYFPWRRNPQKWRPVFGVSGRPNLCYFCENHLYLKKIGKYTLKNVHKMWNYKRNSYYGMFLSHSLVSKLFHWFSIMSIKLRKYLFMFVVTSLFRKDLNLQYAYLKLFLIKVNINSNIIIKAPIPCISWIINQIEVKSNTEWEFSNYVCLKFKSTPTTKYKICEHKCSLYILVNTIFKGLKSVPDFQNDPILCWICLIFVSE